MPELISVSYFGSFVILLFVKNLRRVLRTMFIFVKSGAKVWFCGCYVVVLRLSVSRLLYKNRKK